MINKNMANVFRYLMVLVLSVSVIVLYIRHQDVRNEKASLIQFASFYPYDALFR
jgi:hypothetical protein